MSGFPVVFPWFVFIVFLLTGGLPPKIRELTLPWEKKRIYALTSAICAIVNATSYTVIRTWIDGSVFFADIRYYVTHPPTFDIFERGKMVAS